MSFKFFQKNADQIGIFSSVLCLAHCLSFTLFISLQPFLSRWLGVDFHFLDYFFLLLSYVAVYFATRAADKLMKRMFYAVIILFTVATLFKETLYWMHYPAYAGSVSLIVIHLINLRKRPACPTSYDLNLPTKVGKA